MSTPEDSRTVVLIRSTSEWHATLIADVLRDNNIEAEVSGALTANFRAEAPGFVRVIVPGEKIEEARAVLAAHREAASEIDWSQVDVDSPEG